MKHEHTIGWLLVVVLIVLTTISMGALHTAHTADNNTNVIRKTALAQCERVQSLREEYNSTSYRQRQVIYTLAHTLENQGILDGLPANERAMRLHDIKALEQEAADIKYSPPTNCSEAIKLDGSYHRPPQTSFPANFKP